MRWSWYQGVICLLVALALCNSSQAEITAQLAMDVNTTMGGVTPSNLVAYKGELYFITDIAVHDIYYSHYRQIWKISRPGGTPTIFHDDKDPAEPYRLPLKLAVAGDHLYIHAYNNDNVGKSSIWKSDGTTGGTTFVNINYASKMVSAQDYLIVFDGDNRLWKYGGTSDDFKIIGSFNSWLVANGNIYGTNTYYTHSDTIRNINYYDAFLNKYTLATDTVTTLTRVMHDAIHYTDAWGGEFVNSGPWLFYILNAFTIPNEYHLVATDCNSGVTNTVAAFRTRPQKLTAVGNTLYFSNDGELWKSNGNQGGTIKVASIDMETPWSFADQLLFTGTDPDHGSELWISDGTANGTKLLQDLTPGLAGSTLGNMTNIGATCYFTATTTTGSVSLWKTNGTSSGTIRLLDFPSSDYITLDNFTAVDNMLYFTDSRCRLWHTDGTLAETSAAPLPSLTNMGLLPYALGIIGQRMLFVGNDGLHGQELMTMDDSGRQATLVKDINPGPSDSINIIDLINYSYCISDGRLYFPANDGVHGEELWVSDGTPEGTTMLKDINPQYDTRPHDYIQLHNKVFFFANQSSFMPWVTDGTGAGTQPVKLDAWCNNDASFFKFRDVIYFFASDASNYHLYRINDAGTSATRALATDAEGKNIFQTELNGRMIYKVEKNIIGSSLIRTYLCSTDGSTSYPQILNTHIYDFQNNNPVGYYTPTAVIGDTLFFCNTDNEHGLELWKTQGTSDTTCLVRDIRPGPMNSSLHNFTVLGSRLIFIADDGTHGLTLWASEGTSQTTTMLTTKLLINNSYPVFLGVLGEKMFFSADDGIHGNELWITDGTQDGTCLLKDINPSGNSSPGFLLSIGRYLYFAADDGEHGYEIWRTDGTTEGTGLFMDIYPGIRSSKPSFFMPWGDKFLFSADDGLHGEEPWVLYDRKNASDGCWRFYQ